MWTVRAISGTAERSTVRDTTHDTKRSALAFLRSLNIGEKPTIAKFGHTYCVTVQNRK